MPWVQTFQKSEHWKGRPADFHDLGLLSAVASPGVTCRVLGQVGQDSVPGYWHHLLRRANMFQTIRCPDVLQEEGRRASVSYPQSGRCSTRTHGGGRQNEIHIKLLKMSQNSVSQCILLTNDIWGTLSALYLNLRPALICLATLPSHF